MGGWRDIDLWKAAQVERHFLATGDKGFADIRQYAPGTHAGVLLLRPNEDGIRPVVDLLERVLGGYDLEDLSGSVTVVSARGVRLRCAR
jgi:hypothetical protein